MPFRAAISGLKAASTDLQVIGNNVANSATTGFKRSRTQFQDVFTVSSTGAAANSSGRGVNVGRVAQQFAQGNLSFTDNNLDLAISGRGFFMFDADGTRLYSRDGALGIDRESFIVNSDGAKLQAYGADALGRVTGALGAIQLDEAQSAPAATTQVEVSANFDADAPIPAITLFDPNEPSSYNESTALTVYDSQGGSHLMQLYFVRDGAVENTYNVHTYVDGTERAGPNTLTFDEAGVLETPVTGQIVVPNFTPEPGVNPLAITLSFADSTQFGAQFAVNQLVQDGYTSGRLTSVDINEDGTILARYSNGQSVVKGRVGLATFANEQGLRPIGQNAWVETFSAGAVIEGRPGSGSLGLIQGGALEDSNIDISEELVALIIAQRNFQANTEVISTADAVTQSIINIR